MFRKAAHAGPLVQSRLEAPTRTDCRQGSRPRPVKPSAPEVQAFEVPAREGFEAFLRTVRAYVDFVRQSGHASPRPGLFCGESCPAYRACRAYHGMEAA